MTSQLEALQALLPPGEVFTPASPEYFNQSLPWSKIADLHPSLVIKPTSLSTLQEVVKHIYASKLDFAVRNTGTGSASAKDVILSMQGFKSFHFDAENEVVTAGAGLAWGEVDVFLDEQASEYALVGARVPSVGVTGSSLVGGLS